MPPLDQDDEEDFLKFKDEKRDIEAIRPELKVSKNRMKKIRMEGHFEGKNKTRYDEETGKTT